MFFCTKKISYLSYNFYFILLCSYELIAWHICRTAMVAMQHMSSRDPMDGWRYYIYLHGVYVTWSLYLTLIIHVKWTFGNGYGHSDNLFWARKFYKIITESETLRHPCWILGHV